MHDSSIHRLFIAFTACALLGLGCASSGNNYDESKVSQIEKGKTTEPQLVQIFGSPQQRMVNSDGVVTLIWNYTEMQADKRQFIPLAGPFFAGNSASKNKFMTITLRQGVVSDFSSSSGGNEVRQGTQDVK